MGAFFKGWRRKMGVVTLVLALAFMVGWVRSQSLHDLLMVSWGNDTFCIESMWGEIDFGRVTTQDNRQRSIWISNQITPTSWRWIDEHGNPQPVDHLSEDVDEIEWRWDWAGFHFGVGHTVQGRVEDYVLPYWSIAIPLTLLSAYLMLSKPRNSTLTKPTEPIPADGP